MVYEIFHIWSTPHPIDQLLNLLSSDKDSTVRRSAADALGLIGSESAIDQLLNLLSDEDSWVRMNAAYALGKIGDSRAIEPLKSALKDESEFAGMKAIKDRAFTALEQISHRIHKRIIMSQ